MQNGSVGQDPRPPQAERLPYSLRVSLFVMALVGVLVFVELLWGSREDLLRLGAPILIAIPVTTYLFIRRTKSR
jgi:hypothetical protein